MSEHQDNFWSDVATKYDRVVDAQLGRRLRALIREKLAEETALGNAVEIGCGSGFFTQALARRAESVVATDSSPGMIDLARQSLAGASNVSFQTEDCTRTSFADGTFDTAFMCLVLQFVDALAALGEMHRILMPGGTLIVANLDVFALRVPLRLMLLFRTLAYSAIAYGRAFPRVKRDRLLSEATLRQRLEEAGFRVTHCEMVRDTSRSSNGPINYVKAVKDRPAAL
jgi:ABC-2 type transport system ATP-binding protein